MKENVDEEVRMAKENVAAASMSLPEKEPKDATEKKNTKTRKDQHTNVSRQRSHLYVLRIYVRGKQGKSGSHHRRAEWKRNMASKREAKVAAFTLLTKCICKQNILNFKVSKTWNFLWCGAPISLRWPSGDVSVGVTATLYLLPVLETQA